MNERIRRLRNEAENWVADNFSTDELDSYEWWEKSEQKFAELIVDECCNWIDGSPSIDGTQLLLTKSFIIANLKAHFRV